MNGRDISEVTAENIALEKIKRDLQGEIELVELKPTGGLAYSLNGRDPADYYFFHVNPPRPAIGESRIICVSKKNGEVVFDGYVGE